MKKFIYSTWTKTAALILCLACIFSAAFIAIDNVYDMQISDKRMYAAAVNIDCVDDEIQTAFYAICSADKNGYTINESAVRRRINDEHFDYYILYPLTPRKDVDEANTAKEPLIESPDGTEAENTASADAPASGYREISNTAASSPEDFSGAYYFILDKEHMAASCYFSDGDAQELRERGFKIYISVKQSYLDDIAEAQTHITSLIPYVLIPPGLAFLLFIYLMAVCGKRADGEKLHHKIDCFFIELDLAAAAVCVISAILVFGEFLYISDLSHIIYEIGMIVITVLALLITLICAVFIAAILAVVRNIKHHTLAKHSLIGLIWRTFVKCLKKCRAYSLELRDGLTRLCAQKNSAALTAVLALNAAVLLFIWCPPVLLILEALIIFLTVRTIVGILKIKDGIFEIQKGNVGYKITDIDAGVTGMVAEAVNNIGDGLAASVNEQLKAERMKVDLITNVSHDLKTPLTSIISYSDLLSSMDLSPKEANDYAAIIKQKGERLKNLTSDLFDISKIQSGNERIVREKLDLSLLIRQSIGELDELTAKSKLEFILNLADNTSILADGKKMSRVFENLIGNILKYSLEGTRVYISSECKNSIVTAELKNISAYPLNFDPEEITGRFVRGDKSRSTDGSGLGLAIAKSYTEACGGKFEIQTDGDLFKAIVSFAEA